MKKVKKKAKAASDDAAVRARAPAPVVASAEFANPQWRAMVQYTVGQCTTLLASLKDWDGKPCETVLETATGVDVDVDALQASCGQRLPSLGRDSSVSLIRGAGCFHLEPVGNQTLPPLVGYGVPLAAALWYTRTPPMKKKANKEPELDRHAPPTMADLAALMHDLRCLANLATHAVDKDEALIAYSGCGTYRIAEQDWEDAQVWLPAFTFPGFDDRVDKRLFVDLAALYTIKFLRGDKALTLNDEYGVQYLGDLGHAQLALRIMTDFKDWIHHSSRDPLVRDAAQVFVHRFANAQQHFTWNAQRMHTRDQVLTHLVYALYAPFCDWEQSVACTVEAVDPRLFFRVQSASAASAAPTASSATALPRLDPVLGLQIASALRQVAEEAVEAHSGGWAHFQQCRHLAPYDSLATATQGVGRMYSLAQQQNLVGLYAERTSAFLVAIDGLVGDPKLKFQLENTTVIKKTLEVNKELKLKSQDTRRIALLSAALAVAFRAPGYDCLVASGTVNLCSTKPKVGITASRDAFGSLKCGARLLLKMLQSLATPSEGEEERHLFVLLALTDLVAQWDDRVWLAPANKAEKYLERFWFHRAAHAVMLGDDLKRSMLPVCRGEDACLAEAVGREAPSCAVNGSAAPSLQEVALQKRLDEKEAELRRANKVATAQEKQIRVLKRKLEAFQGGPSEVAAEPTEAVAAGETTETTETTETPTAEAVIA